MFIVGLLIMLVAVASIILYNVFSHPKENKEAWYTLKQRPYTPPTYNYANYPMRSFKPPSKQIEDVQYKQLEGGKD